MAKRKLITVLTAISFLIIINNFCFGQKQGQAKIDSLQALLINYVSPCQESCLTDSLKVTLLNNLAWAFRNNKIDTALILSRDALSLSEKINWKIGIGDSYHQLGLFNFLKDDFAASLVFNYKAIDIWNKLLQNENDNKRIIKKKSTSMTLMGSVYSSRGDYYKALTQYSESIKLDSSINNTEGILRNLGNMGITYVYLGKYESAINIFFSVLKIAEEKKDYDRMAMQYLSIGNTYNRLKDYIKAIQYFNEAIKISDINGNLINKFKSLQGIGIAYGRMENIDMSLKYHLQAYELEVKAKGDASPPTLIGLANSYYRKNDFANSLLYNENALKRANEIKDKNSIGICLLNIGNVYSQNKNYINAEEYLLKAVISLKEVEDNYTLAQAYTSLSELYDLQNKSKEAFSYYKNAVAINDSLFSSEKSKEITQIEMNYEFDKKEALARAEYDKQIAVSDKKRTLAEMEKKLALTEADKKLIQSETEKRIAIAEAEKKQMIAEADKKEIELESENKMAAANAENKRQKFFIYSIACGSAIILLSGIFTFIFYKRKRDAEQKQKETLLSLQVSETEMKALRSQMNPHFIFNALQSIQTFLLGHKSEEANLYLLKFSKLMRAVLENSQHSEVPLEKDIQALELYMQLESIRLPLPFTYQFHIDKSVDVESDFLPPLILQPFVENAIWHGLQYKPEAGHINIFITKIDNALHATVEDNGVGRDMSKQVAQPMLMKKESLGMKLTEERLKVLNEVKKFNARFIITDLFTKDNQPSGTKVELSLPLLA